MSSTKFYNNPHLLRFLVFVVLLVVVVQGVFIVGKLNDPDVYGPLGKYSIVHVNNPAGNLGIPEIGVQDDLRTDIERCSTSDQDVDVLVDVRWQTVSPRGISIESTSNATNVWKPGCNVDTYVVPIPTTVQLKTKDLSKDGTAPIIWRLAGSDTPIDSNGKAGIPKEWASQTFVLVP